MASIFADDLDTIANLVKIKVYNIGIIILITVIKFLRITFVQTTLEKHTLTFSQ